MLAKLPEHEHLIITNYITCQSTVLKGYLFPYSLYNLLWVSKAESSEYIELVRHIIALSQITIVPTVGLPVAIISYNSPLSSKIIKHYTVYCTDAN